jgi:plasmid stabilization system protein ParE
MRVVWTLEARARLRDIRAYISAESAHVADRVVDTLLRRSEQLEMLPNSGKTVAEYADKSVKELLVRPYRLIYTKDDDVVYILTVKHYRQRLPKKLFALISTKE